MESVQPSAVTPRSSKLVRTLTKVLHVKAIAGISPLDRLKNVKVDGANPKDEGNMSNKGEEEELQKRMATEALLAKVFASISTVKSSYAQLQHAQSPYDPAGIQAADKSLVSELKTLSELKRCYFNKKFDPSPERAIAAAESKELKSALKTYEIMGKKLESQVSRRESEIMSLREMLEEAIRHNKSIEKRLSQSGLLSNLDNLHISGLSPTHFVAFLRHTVRSIRSFVKLLVNEMRSAGWDIDASVNAIEENVFYCKEDHKCFAIESFVCREMFDSFNFPNFSLPNESLPDDSNNKQEFFFGRFNELKSVKAKEFLVMKQRSPFERFCRVKYSTLVHPKMEASLFGDLSQRNMIIAGGEFPESNFFTTFAEMAKRVWLLHCLAFSFEPQAEIFQVGKGCRFSDVYMESVANDAMMLPVESELPQVAFTVVPGFRIGKTVLQCQVYLSQVKNISSLP